METVERLMKCTECPWAAETPEDCELITENGEVIDLAHIGCPECGGMLAEIEGA